MRKEKKPKQQQQKMHTQKKTTKNKQTKQKINKISYFPNKKYVHFHKDRNHK